MADKVATDASAAEEPTSKLVEMITSFGLIAFTIAVGLLCVLVLACTLTQTRMSGMSIDGVNISIWKLNDIRKQWNDIRLQISKQSRSLPPAETTRVDAEKNFNDYDIYYKPARTALDELLEEFHFVVQPFDPALAKAMAGNSPAEQMGRLDAAKGSLKDHPELQPLIGKITTAYEAYRPVGETHLKLRAARDAARSQAAGVQDGMKSLRASLDSLFAEISRKPLDDPTRSRIENALFEMYSVEGPLGKFINGLIITQPDILTLALVILMGLLGSALQMTHALFKRSRVERFGVYFLRLSVGAITALVIFIVAKAGVPVVTDASRLGGDAPINPYFVSFLAIISGLMSENAILSVQTQGARFFAPETVPDQLRWARFDLHEAFKKASRDPDNVKRLLNAEDSQFDAWISGKEPLPGSAQTMIAGVLETPRRELFTDIPPEEARQSADGVSAS